LIRETQDRRSEDAGGSAEKVARVWAQWTEAYFLRYTPEKSPGKPRCSRPGIITTKRVVAIRQLTDRGGNAVLITRRRGCLTEFCANHAVLDKMGLNVVDARMSKSANCLVPSEDYVVSRTTARVIADAARIRENRTGPVAQSCRSGIRGDGDPRAPARCAVLQPTQVNLSVDSRNGRTISSPHRRGPPGIALRSRQGLPPTNALRSTAPKS